MKGLGQGGGQLAGGPGQESGGLQGVRELRWRCFREGGQNKAEARPPRPPAAPSSPLLPASAALLITCLCSDCPFPWSVSSARRKQAHPLGTQFVRCQGGVGRSGEGSWRWPHREQRREAAVPVREGGQSSQKERQAGEKGLFS